MPNLETYSEMWLKIYNNKTVEATALWNILILNRFCAVSSHWIPFLVRISTNYKIENLFRKFNFIIESWLKHRISETAIY